MWVGVGVYQWSAFSVRVIKSSKVATDTRSAGKEALRRTTDARSPLAQASLQDVGVEEENGSVGALEVFPWEVVGEGALVREGVLAGEGVLGLESPAQNGLVYDEA